MAKLKRPNAETQRLDTAQRRQKLAQAIQTAFETSTKTVLLTGPSGCGKTTTLKSVLCEFNIEKICFSDAFVAEFKSKRTRTSLAIPSLHKAGGNSTRTVYVIEHPLLALKKHGEALKEICLRTDFPIIIETTADLAMDTIRVSFAAVSEKKIREILRKTAPKEASSLLDAIARNSGGNMHKAINDLGFWSTAVKKSDARQISPNNQFSEMHTLAKILYPKPVNHAILLGNSENIQPRLLSTLHSQLCSFVTDMDSLSALLDDFSLAESGCFNCDEKNTLLVLSTFAKIHTQKTPSKKKMFSERPETQRLLKDAWDVEGLLYRASFSALQTEKSHSP
ncbi:MAG: uncharacterized protein A8A55_1389 [Amphiamblys sp. WSBS2006]|nr:MAG: uncharacterized protein A8A55_1389 [Amphiamblys sp. WSBS2006]